jgi:hypothetical protein
MTYMLEVPDKCHDSTLWNLQDVGRVSPMHGVHPPPAFASPLEDSPPRP